MITGQWPQTYTQFARSMSLIPDEEITSAIYRACLEFCENTYMAPGWWDSLPNNVRDSVIDRMTLSARPDQPRKEGALTDDGVEFPRLTVVSRQTVGFDL